MNRKLDLRRESVRRRRRNHPLTPFVRCCCCNGCVRVVPHAVHVLPRVLPERLPHIAFLNVAIPALVTVGRHRQNGGKFGCQTKFVSIVGWFNMSEWICLRKSSVAISQPPQNALSVPVLCSVPRNVLTVLTLLLFRTRRGRAPSDLVVLRKKTECGGACILQVLRCPRRRGEEKKRRRGGEKQRNPPKGSNKMPCSAAAV